MLSVRPNTAVKVAPMNPPKTGAEATNVKRPIAESN